MTEGPHFDQETLQLPLDEKTTAGLALIVFGTNKLTAAKEAERVYTNYKVTSLGARSEPRNGRSRWPATAKNNDVVLNYVDKDGDKADYVVTQDVSFLWKDKVQHRPDRDGQVSAAEAEKVKKKALKRYTKPFEAAWEVTFAVTALDTLHSD
jgi:hypothetical protein